MRAMRGSSTATIPGPAVYLRKLEAYHSVTCWGWGMCCSPRMAANASTAQAARCRGGNGLSQRWGSPAAKPSPRELPATRQMEAKGRVSRRSQDGSLHQAVAKRMDLEGGRGGGVRLRPLPEGGEGREVGVGGGVKALRSLLCSGGRSQHAVALGNAL